MSRSKKIAIILLPLLLALLGGYYFFWTVVAREIGKQIDNMWIAMADGGAVIVGDKPAPTGFPLPPVVTFQGTITEANGTVWEFPELTYSGFPIPGSLMQLDLPAGLNLSGPIFPEPVSIQETRLYIRLPYNLPRDQSEATIRAWQQAGGAIPIEKLFVKSGELQILGQGKIGLDDKLQVSGELNTRVVGMDALLADLTEKKIIEGRSAVMAQSFLQMIIQRDPATGITFFDTVIRIQNRGVFLGPLRVASLPELSWSSDSQPVPHQ